MNCLIKYVCRNVIHTWIARGNISFTVLCQRVFNIIIVGSVKAISNSNKNSCSNSIVVDGRTCMCRYVLQSSTLELNKAAGKTCSFCGGRNQDISHRHLITLGLYLQNIRTTVISVLDAWNSNSCVFLDLMGQIKQYS